MDLAFLGRLERRLPVLAPEIAVALGRQERVVVVQDGLADLGRRQYILQPAVDRGFDRRKVVCQLTARLDEAIEPLFDNLDLVGKVERGRTKGGRV